MTKEEKAVYDRARRDRDGGKLKAQQRNGHLLRRYGISAEQYNEMLRRQGGVCALCHLPPGTKSLCVDHDHSTDRVRGLLCAPCNSALGKWGDDEDGVLRVLAYVRGESYV